MTRKPIRKPDNPKQSKRFLNLAREVEAKGDPETFKAAVKKIAPHHRGKPLKKRA